MDTSNNSAAGAGSPPPPPPPANAAGSPPTPSPAVGLTPAAKPVTLDFGIQPASLDFNPDDVEMAAAELGLIRFSARTLLASRTLGRAIRSIGAISVGRSILYLSAEQLARAVTECETLIAETTDTELAARLLEVKQKLIDSQVSVATRFIKSAESDQSDESSMTPSLPGFGPRQMVVPIQAETVNINNQDGTKPPDK